MPYYVGDRVEILGLQDGTAQTFFEGTVVRVYHDNVRVRYATVLDNEGRSVVDAFAISEIRPYPAQIRGKINPGDDINAWEGNMWLRGRYRSYKPRDPEGLVHRVYFPHKPQGQKIRSYAANDVRFHQEFEFPNSYQLTANWTYTRVRMGYKVGDKVEVLGFEEGFENSFFGATVDQVLPQQLIITYETLQNDEHKPLQETVDMENVRPYPASIVADCSPGDDVDVFYNDGWWWGIYDEYQPENPDGMPHQVYFDYMVDGQTESNYRREDIRLHQEFEFQGQFRYIGVWTYTKRM